MFEVKRRLGNSEVTGSIKPEDVTKLKVSLLEV
jgi:hypothetical protein